MLFKETAMTSGMKTTWAIALFIAASGCRRDKSVPVRIKIWNESPHGSIFTGQLRIVIAGGELRAPLEWSAKLEEADGEVFSVPQYYVGKPGGLYVESPNYHLDGSPVFSNPLDGILVVRVKEGPPTCAINGVVLAPSRRRLPGIRLRILPGGEEGVTDADGAYRIV